MKELLLFAGIAVVVVWGSLAAYIGWKEDKKNGVRFW